MRLDRVTVQQARAVQSFAPASWTICETPEGWIVQRGEALLISSVSKQVRRFGSVDTAIRRLKQEVGITSFRIEAMKEAATPA